MRIKSSGQSHALYRYGGVVDTKTFEVKIGTVLVGTAPDLIPVDILDELTPKETRALREFLALAQVSIFRSRFAVLTTEIGSVTRLVNAENLDISSVDKMIAALAGLQSAIRRVQKVQKTVSGQQDQPEQLEQNSV